MTSKKILAKCAAVIDIFGDKKTGMAGSDTLQNRYKALKSVEDIIESKLINEESLVLLINETIELINEPQLGHDVRLSLWSFFKCLVRHQAECLGKLRVDIFDFIRKYDTHDCDTVHRLALLSALSNNGRDISLCERSIGPFMLSWMPKVIEMNNNQITVEFLTLLKNMTAHNGLYFDKETINAIIDECYRLTQRRKIGDEVCIGCYDFIDVVARYSYLPTEKLETVTIVLCKGFNLSPSGEQCWRVMKSLLETPLGHSLIYAMCHLLRDGVNHEDICLLGGCIYFLTESLWGPKKISSLKHTPNSVLPAFVDALDCRNTYIANEVTLSIQRLVEKMFDSLAMVTWDLILKICQELTNIVSEQLKNNKKNNGKEKNGVHNKEREFHKAVQVLLETIEELNENNKYFGDTEKLFSVLESFSSKRPVCITIA